MSQTLRSVVGIFAHPDDETIFTGGMTAMLVEKGIPVHFVCATHGEGGEAGEPPIVSDIDQLGPAREQELRCAASTLGAAVSVLDYVDPRIGPNEELSPFEADFDALVEQFAAIISELQADLVLTHGVDGEYGHPAHQLVHRAVMACVRNHHLEVPVYTVAALVPDIDDHIWNQSQPAHYALDITPWAATKIAAMECHRSQHALFKRRRKLNTVAEALRSIESVHRVWPETANGDLPGDAFARILRDAGAWTPEFEETDGK
jgi:LmbE family N-acetylglucosaminyl deacetylase